jgi:hypothetical protein
MAKKSASVVYVNAQESREFAETIAHRIATAKVKTATPSRSQNKIQVRVTWTEPNGKPGLGYYSMDTGTAESLGKKSSGPLLKNFVDDLFRTLQWAKAHAEKKYRSDDYGPFQSDLHDELIGLGIFTATAGIHDLYKKAMASIQTCVQAGLHRSQRRTKNQEKAKAFLENNILFALKNGLTDADINDVVQLAFVKHTMES